MVSGCSSDSLGLFNTVSEVIEAVCMGIEEPYEVVSSEDMLARVYECNKKLAKEYDGQDDKKEKVEKDNGQSDKMDKNNSQEDKNKKEIKDMWTDNILLGSDVKALFPSLSAEETGKAVRKQISKSPVKWNNVDWKLLTLYIFLIN